MPVPPHPELSSTIPELQRKFSPCRWLRSRPVSDRLGVTPDGRAEVEPVEVGGARREKKKSEAALSFSPTYSLFIMFTMQALIVEKAGVAVLKQVPVPALSPGEVLIKVRTSSSPSSETTHHSI